MSERKIGEVWEYEPGKWCEVVEGNGHKDGCHPKPLTGKAWAATLLAGEHFECDGVEWVVLWHDSKVLIAGVGLAVRLFDCILDAGQWTAWKSCLANASDDTVTWIRDRKGERI